MDTQLLKDALVNLAEAKTLIAHWAQSNKQSGLQATLRKLGECQETVKVFDQELGEPETPKTLTEIEQEFKDMEGDDSDETN